MSEMNLNASRLPWRITSADERKGREIVDAHGATVAKLTLLDMANAELIVSSVNARRTAPVSASLDTQALPPPKYPQMKVLIHGELVEQCGYTVEQVRGLAEHIKKLERELKAARTVSDQHFADILTLRAELEQAKSAFEGSEAARKDAERARGPVQSVDTPEFRALAQAWSDAAGESWPSKTLECWNALIAYIDGRTAGTAPDGWKPVHQTFYGVEGWRDIEEHAVDEHKSMGFEVRTVYVAAAPTPINSGMEEANGN
jgi:hypothetical protein